MKSLVCAILASTVLASPLSAANSKHDPLRQVDALVPKALARWNNPGVAVAIVSNGKTVYAKGFGVREPGRPELVDADTVFPIASLTKGFTSALAGALAAEGVVDLDEPLVRLLPELELTDPAVTRQLTLRDALAHRSGLASSSDLLWLVSGFDAEEILAHLRFVPQETPFRSRESYQNVLALAAGEALARRTGTSWEALVRTRLVEPLGLARTFTSSAAARSDASGNLASLTVDDSGVRKLVTPEDPMPIAPAAAIHSTARDLARWTQLFLARGDVDGKRILPEAVIDSLLKPQTLQEIGPGYKKLMPETHLMAWALGWVVQDYRGRLLAWNTGGLSGCSGTIAFLPEENLGVVVLSNDGRTGFPEGIAWSVLDLMTGAPPKDWVGLRLERSRKAAENRDLARAKAVKERILGTTPTLSPSVYAGDWSQDLLGKAAVTLDSKSGDMTLRVEKGPIAKMTHWHRETWMAEWEPFGWGFSRVTFQLGADGSPERMVVEDIGEFRREPAK